MCACLRGDARLTDHPEGMKQTMKEQQRDVIGTEQPAERYEPRLLVPSLRVHCVSAGLSAALKSLLTGWSGNLCFSKV